MATLLWTLLIASLFANIIMSYQSTEATFFLTTYRAWEFLGGSLLSWWHFGKNHEEKLPCNNWISLTGLLLIGLGMALSNHENPYPGWRGILPVLGTLLIIGAGKQSWINRHFLSNRVIVWIGLISYLLYLFHWPPLAFVHIVKGDHPDFYSICLALGAAFILTLAVYYLIERPIRFSKSKKVVPILVFTFIATGFLGVLFWKGIIRSPWNAGDLKMQNVEYAIHDNGWCENFTKFQLNKVTDINKIGRIIEIYKIGG